MLKKQESALEMSKQDLAEYQEWLRTDYRPIAGGDGSEDGYVEGDDNPPVDEPGPEDEGVGSEGSQGQQGQQGQQTDKPLYTPEEMRNLPFDQIDTSRIPAEMQPFYKAMQGAFTRSRQEESGKLRELESTVNRMRQTPPQAMSPKEQVFASYMQNPAAVEAELRTDIQRLEDAAADALAVFDNVKASGLLKQKAVLIGALEEMRTRRTEMVETQGRIQTLTNAVHTGLLQEIPDYNKIVPEMSQFVASAGVDPRVVSIVTNPAVLDTVMKNLGIYDVDGVTAVKQLVKFVHSGFQRERALKTGAMKQDKTPTRTMTPGTGGDPNVGGPKRVSGDQKTDLERAKKSGDFSDYFMKYHGVL